MTYFGNYRVPDRMMASLRGYIKHGHPVGGFLFAVLTNNLKEAVGRADSENLANLPAYVGYLYNEAPAACWGSEAKVKAWLEGGFS